jgi:hypothetical protein
MPAYFQLVVLGGFMRSWWMLPLSALVLVGCGQPEIDACEAYTKSGLRSPATYRKVAVKTIDESVTPEEFLKRRGDNPSDPARGLFLDGMRHSKVGIRNVVISYDADNAYGTPVRAEAICMFELRDGKLKDDTKEIQTRVKLAETDRDFRAMARAGALPNQGPIDAPEKACCL